MRLLVEGKHPLNGTYRPSGSANAAQALLAAALLTEAPVTLRNMPHTASTQGMLHLAELLGASLKGHDPQTATVGAAPVTRRVLEQAETDATVGVILFVAPLLVRRQHVRLEIDFPLSRIRTHLEALRELGIDVVNSSGAVEFKSATWERKDIVLAQASVTATAIVLMLAARLGKETVIENAACEPHIQELAHMLTAMGAKVEGIGANVLRVWGTNELGGADVTVGPDHIEAASVAAISAMSGGRVKIEGIRQSDMRIIAKSFWRLGIQVDMDETTMYIPRHETLTVSNREEDV